MEGFELRRRLTTPLFAVAVSFCALYAVQSGGTYLVHLFTEDTRAELITYFGGVAAAVLALKRLFPVELPKGEKHHLSCAVTALLASVIMLSVSFLPALQSTADTVPSRTVPQILFAAFFGVLVKPLFEEYLFRGLYMSALDAFFDGLSCGEQLSVAVSSVLFAMWHPSTPVFALFCAALLGELMLYMKKKGVKHPLVFPVIAHAVYNAVLYGCELALAA